MKNVAIINLCNHKSTGKIAMGFYKNLKLKGYKTFFYYGRGLVSTDPNIMKIDSEIEVRFHALMARLTGRQGAYSHIATWKMVKSMEKHQIDTVFLINPHGYYLNELILFDYVANKNIRLIYTLIDEYAYLGACANEPECQKYMTGVGKCPDIGKYPKSLFFDACGALLKRKLKCYQKMNNAVFVGPEFLINRASKSFLGQYMNKIVLDEAIDLDFYRPREPAVLRKKLNISEDKIIILCVAPTSNPLKGGDYFIKAAKHFYNDERFVFIHIGYRYDDVESLPSNFLPIGFVEKDEDLAVYYSLADLLIYPSIADAMSNVCLESFACGTPIVCFNISGMPYLMDNTVGELVPPKDVNALICVIDKAKKKAHIEIDICRNYALKRYDNKKYIETLIRIAENV